MKECSKEIQKINEKDKPVESSKYIYIDVSNKTFIDISQKTNYWPFDQEQANIINPLFTVE